MTIVLTFMAGIGFAKLMDWLALRYLILKQAEEDAARTRAQAWVAGIKRKAAR